MCDLAERQMEDILIVSSISKSPYSLSWILTKEGLSLHSLLYSRTIPRMDKLAGSNAARQIRV